MNIKILNTDAGRGVIISYGGKLTGSDIARFIENRADNLQFFQKVLYDLSDFSAVESLEVTGEQVEMIAGLVKELRDINPIFIEAVVGSKKSIYGWSRMYEIYQNNRDDHRSFTSIEDAKAWITTEMKQRHGFEPTFE